MKVLANDQHSSLLPQSVNLKSFKALGAVVIVVCCQLLQLLFETFYPEQKADFASFGQKYFCHQNSFQDSGQKA
jgi:hypothetical protein